MNRYRGVQVATAALKNGPKICSSSEEDEGTTAPTDANHN
ncbi:hypothetical protein CpipJ_CPIJ013515 [Culex quinquefasciatus]|uniref:Uncharacterized protein n=1 Tax=Culex quinquefasciatus TaxID=7176 RepID=B0X278_CULQU|nr:hypothetical protein CpipJ_CPIJ013515 [Culex quinquefasciatus]|eukprot:XP_001863750.1 hypothetical protein CpipJ_CPIJ013515 [Culex quinquefasciatus]